MPRPEQLSRAQARRVALAAQGFLDPPHAVPTMRTLSRTVARTGVLQVDSVNVLQRAHYLPLYSRMGPYDVGLLHRAAESPPRRLVEYWAHVQAYMPVELWPVMRHRMAAYRARRGKWGFAAREGLPERLVEEIAARGAVTARELDDGRARTREHWGWNWSAARQALDYAFLCGDLAIAGRTAQFEVRYDLPERVVPLAVLALPALSREEAIRELLLRAAASHGVATAASLVDYYRLQQEPDGAGRVARGLVVELAASGELVPVAVEGWSRPAYLHPDARLPRRVEACTLLSPFDPLVWERARTEELFGFRYRIEIYVPRHQRVHGYYVLPFLLGDRLVARVDLKADRPAGTLRVQAAHREHDAPSETPEELAAELWRLAGWLGLDAVEVADRGDLAASLAAAVPAARAWRGAPRRRR